jgi:cytochrome oxidase assembly protein ShyY1
LFGMKQRKWYFKISLRYMIAPIGMALGIWQLRRHYWKQDLLRDIDSAKNNAPIPFIGQDIDYKRIYEIDNVKIDFENPLKVGPKGIRRNEDNKIVFSNAVICPIIVGSRKLLLHLGWLPIEKSFNPSTDIHKIKVSREKDEPSGFIVKNEVARGIWKVKDISQISSYFKTEPVLLKLLGNPVCEDMIIKEININEIPNRHLEYVFTWTGLSLTAFIFSFII